MPQQADRCQNQAKNFSQNPSKRAAERQKPQNQPAADAHEKEQPKLSKPGIEREQQRGGERAEAEKKIQRMRQKSEPFAHRAQQVIINAQTDAQHDRQYQLDGLQRYRQLHQPNKRENRPPERWFSS